MCTPACAIAWVPHVHVMFICFSLSLRCAQPTRGSNSSKGPSAAASGEKWRGKHLQSVRTALHWTVLTGHESGQHLWTEWVVYVCVSACMWKSGGGEVRTMICPSPPEPLCIWARHLGIRLFLWSRLCPIKMLLGLWCLFNMLFCFCAQSHRKLFPSFGFDSWLRCFLKMKQNLKQKSLTSVSTNACGINLQVRSYHPTFPTVNIFHSRHFD